MTASTDALAAWSKAGEVPTTTVTIKGVNGTVVATINVIGKVDSMNTTYPYKSSTTPS